MEDMSEFKVGDIIQSIYNADRIAIVEGKMIKWLNHEQGYTNDAWLVEENWKLYAPEFQVGDWVERIDGSWRGVNVGDVKKVVGVTSHGNIELEGVNDGSISFKSSNFRKLTKEEVIPHRNKVSNEALPLIFYSTPRGTNHWDDCLSYMKTYQNPSFYKKEPKMAEKLLFVNDFPETAKGKLEKQALDEAKGEGIAAIVEEKRKLFRAGFDEYIAVKKEAEELNERVKKFEEYLQIKDAEKKQIFEEEK